MAKYSAMDIAKWFTKWSDFNDADLSNMKLQKLLYYAQGHYLAEYGEPLFDEEIEAWSHGPVVPVVYQSYKEFGPNDIPAADDFELSQIDPKTTEFLQKVWNTYGGFAAWKLRSMTHSEGPWNAHFVDDERNIVIPKDSLRHWFKSVTQQ